MHDEQWMKCRREVLLGLCKGHPGDKAPESHAKKFLNNLVTDCALS